MHLFKMFIIAVSIALLALACRNTLPILTDVDGNRYHTVQIGTQVWMAENLRVTRTLDGKPVSSHFPNDDSGNVNVYGRLYDWQTALKVAPKGWHIPTDKEWNILSQFVGTLGAAKLKNTLLWQTSLKSATNETGFSALPAGYWNDGGFENRFGLTAVFWSSTRADSHFVWSRTISANHDTLHRAQQHPQYGFSIRCIKD